MPSPPCLRRLAIAAVVGSLLLLVVAVMPLAATAAPFQSASNGYTIDLSDDWVQVPDAELRKMTANVQRAGTSSPITFEAGFQPQANTRWLEYPYVLVQVTPYRTLGLNRQITENEFPKLVKAITGIDFEKTAGENLSSEALSVLSEVKVGKPQLDSAQRRFVWENEMQVGGVGKVRGSTTGFFGHDALVTVNFYGLDKDWDGSAGTRRAITGSFRFNPSSAFNPADDRREAARRLGYLFGRAIVPIAVVAVIVTVIVRSIRKKPQPHSQQWPPPPPPPVSRPPGMPPPLP